MKNIKMIVTDLDKTLLRKDKTISEYTKSVLRKCHASGFLIVFATARPERATKQWQPCETSVYVISNNGATISLAGNTIRNIDISEDAKHSLIKRFVDDGDINGMTVEVGEYLYTNDKEYETWSDFGNDAGWNPVYHDFLTPITEKVCKFSVECKSPEIIADILRDWPELRLFYNNGEYWHQITHQSASKFNAIAYISDLTDIPVTDIVAFGDDYNDVEMIKKCGIGVAVANAVAEAKQVADFICRLALCACRPKQMALQR